jgi:hypothetical protein
MPPPNTKATTATATPGAAGRSAATSSRTRASGTPAIAGYSQPLRRNPRYSPRQITAIVASTSG